MCNLNLIVKKDGVENQEVLGFLTSVTLESYLENSHADGVYYSGSKKLIKGLDKINMCQYPKSTKNSNFIITHQRIATSGKEVDFAQPFKCDEKEFVLIHNGIINEFKKVTGSDTHGYFYSHFLVKFSELRGSREKKIINAIKQTMKECTGSYSIAIFDVKKQRLYYFKNMSRSISFFKADDDKILYITTRDDNKKYLSFFYRPFSEMTIKDKRIYRITIKKKIEVKKVGKIEKIPETRTTTVYGGYRHGRYGAIQQEDRFNTWEKSKNDAIEKANSKAVEDIFSAGEVEKKENKRCGNMFNKYLTKNDSLEDMLLDEMLDSGYTMRDMGFYENSISQKCSFCYTQMAQFSDCDGSPICISCLKDKRDTIEEQTRIVDEYMCYRGIL